MVATNTALTNQSFLEQLNLSAYPPQLAQKYQKIVQEFKKKSPQSYAWVVNNISGAQELTKFVQQLMVAITLAGQLALSKPVEEQVRKNLAIFAQKQDKELLDQITDQEWEEVMQKMVSYVNMGAGHLAQEDELYLEQQLTDMLGFDVSSTLEGHQLNHSIGIMGGEQHVLRYPGDTLANHDAFQEAGIAPQRAAFGWFTEDGELTEKAIMREKYYFAVQTLYLPDWNSNHAELKPWYKFRKMIVINPVERIAVVGVVGDAGPAMWVKKQFGGSPEVIREGKIWSPASKGKVILLFVDDPNDQVALGPINLDELKNTINQ